VWLPTLLLTLLLPRPAAAQAGIGPDDEVVLRCNQIRESAGLAPLARNRTLDLAAQLHAEDMAQGNFMSHYGSNGSNPAVRIRAAGYPWITWAENVAVGYPTAAAVVNAWMNSPGHRHNILNPNVREIGIGLAQMPGTQWRTFWVQDFGTRRGAVTAPSPVSEETGSTPVIEESSPAAGPSGTLVIIEGHGFGSGEGACLVLYGVTGTAEIESWTDTRIVVRLYNATLGPGTIRVCNSSGQTSNPAIFQVTP
jgi:hypothetical protein